MLADELTFATLTEEGARIWEAPVVLKQWQAHSAALTALIEERIERITATELALSANPVWRAMCAMIEVEDDMRAFVRAIVLNSPAATNFLDRLRYHGVEDSALDYLCTIAYIAIHNKILGPAQLGP